MSFSLSSVRYLAWLKSRLSLSGPVLLLGRQMVFARRTDVAWAIRAQGEEPYAQPPESDGPNIVGLDPDRFSTYTNDVCVLRMLLGDVDVDAVDIDGYQGADVIHDLTQPLPDGLKSKYGLVIDAGTLEHIINPVQVMENLVSALRPGGTIIHMTPTAGYVDHGYFQFGPLFFDTYYRSKGMTIDGLCLVEQPARRTNHTQWRFWAWNKALKRKKLLSMDPLSTFCAARRTIDCAASGSTVQNFAEYLEADSERAHEVRPWGLVEVAELRTRTDYPLEQL
ncbi:class I SAM-dependent methyltransferase [Burkholderia cenocepacia]|uniref:class I SAM-dependent methyltransferase n=1 Tax=Burkholderia cenocepacia TaxID=95486 RepID=UPI002AB69021|nr:class I SAM-dependent methyltransferase [Burkholderia cenocepacia]